MMIDKRAIATFVSLALVDRCDAFSFGAVSSSIVQKKPDVQRQQNPLNAFASDRGETITQYEHFAISSDPSSPSNVSQESRTTPLAPPPMARPTEDNKLAMVDKNMDSSRASAPPAAVEGEGQPLERKQSVWERNKAADVQGGSLRTWSFANQHKIDMIQVHMKTDGRPMNANGKGIANCNLSNCSRFDAIESFLQNCVFVRPYGHQFSVYLHHHIILCSYILNVLTLTRRFLRTILQSSRLEKLLHTSSYFDYDKNNLQSSCGKDLITSHRKWPSTSKMDVLGPFGVS